MKKTILLLLTCILCAAFFTSCPHETQSEQEQKTDKYPREFNFDKETFDAQRKAWEDAGIKNYYFTRGFNIGGATILKKTTVENEVCVSKEYFWRSTTKNQLYGDSIVFGDYEEIDEWSLYKAPNHFIDKIYAEDIQTAPDYTIDDIYREIEKEYLLMKETDMKQEKIAKMENKIQYDLNYHIPLFFEWKIISEEEYDGAHLNGESFGWKNQIYDFKVLD